MRDDEREAAQRRDQEQESQVKPAVALGTNVPARSSRCDAAIVDHGSTTIAVSGQADVSANQKTPGPRPFLHPIVPSTIEPVFDWPGAINLFAAPGRLSRLPRLASCEPFPRAIRPVSDSFRRLGTRELI